MENLTFELKMLLGDTYNEKYFRFAIGRLRRKFKKAANTDKDIIIEKFLTLYKEKAYLERVKKDNQEFRDSLNLAHQPELQAMKISLKSLDAITNMSVGEIAILKMLNMPKVGKKITVRRAADLKCGEEISQKLKDVPCKREDLHEWLIRKGYYVEISDADIVLKEKDAAA